MAKKRSGRKSMSLSIFSILALALVIITVPLLLVPFYNMQLSGGIGGLSGSDTLHTATGFDFLAGFFTKLSGGNLGADNFASALAFSEETNVAAMLTGAFVLVLLIAAALYLIFFLLGVCGVIKKAKNLLNGMLILGVVAMIAATVCCFVIAGHYSGEISIDLVLFEITGTASGWTFAFIPLITLIGAAVLNGIKK